MEGEFEEEIGEKEKIEWDFAEEEKYEDEMQKAIHKNSPKNM